MIINEEVLEPVERAWLRSLAHGPYVSAARQIPAALFTLMHKRLAFQSMDAIIITNQGLEVFERGAQP